MNGKKRRGAAAVLLAVLFCFSVCPLRGFCRTAGEAVVSVEAFTIRSGYLVQPQYVSLEREDNAAKLLLELLEREGYQAFCGGSAADGFYLAYIASGDKTGDYGGYAAKCAPASPRVLQITPRFHPSLRSYLETYMEWFDPADETVAEGYLGEFCISAGAGWMFSLNGEFLQKELSAVRLRDGDVLRVQFSTCFGADVGGAQAGSAEAFTITVEDRTALTAAIAEAKRVQADAAAVDEAVNTASNLTATRGELQWAHSALSAAINRAKDPPPAVSPETVPPVTAPPVTAPPVTAPPPTSAPITAAPPTAAPPSKTEPAQETAVPPESWVEAQSAPAPGDALTEPDGTGSETQPSVPGEGNDSNIVLKPRKKGVWRAVIITATVVIAGGILAPIAIAIDHHKKKENGS